MQEPGYHLICELVLCENLSVYFCISCCCAAKHLSFNLSSSLLSELTLLLQGPSILGKNGRDSQKCSVSSVKVDKISMDFIHPCVLVLHVLYSPEQSGGDETLTV